MSSPFPGMDPYLESPDIWPDLHDALAGEIRAALNRSLPAPYYARLEMRLEIGIVDETDLRRIVPDVAIVHRPVSNSESNASALLDRPRTRISDAIEVHCVDEKPRHHTIEIRDASRGHKLVTLIEIVSPSNKQRGPDRVSYLKKQREVLSSDASLIAIDLLRAGERPLPDATIESQVIGLAEPVDYLTFVSKAWDRGTFLLYPRSVREMLPCIPVPLREGQPDVPLDLQFVLDQAFDSGPYLRGAIDYRQPIEPPLLPDDAAWAINLTQQIIAGK